MLLKPGFLPASALRTVAPGTKLLAPTAQAFNNLVLIAKMWDNTHVAPVDDYGSGYRSWDVAMVYYHAGQGDKTAAKRAGIDPNLRVNIAYPPGSHGGGTRIDMLFNGHSPNENNVTLARRYGFTREFGTDDANHFAHDGKTAVEGVRGVDKIALVARWLNSRHLGRTTNTEQSGQADTDFVWLIQHAGHVDKTYPVACREDGVTGPNTQKTLDHNWNVLKARYS